MASLSTVGPNSGPQYAAKLVGNTPVANGWRLLRLTQPELATVVRPGQRLAFAAAGQRLELYVSHCSAAERWLALLAPPGLTATDAIPLQTELLVDGPIGAGWPQPETEAPAVIVGSGSGIGAALFLAERLAPAPRLVLLGSGGIPLPFRPAPSQYLIEGLPPPVIASVPTLEGKGIASRIADPDRPGCFDGSVLELFRLWQAGHPGVAGDVYICTPEEKIPELPGTRLHIA